MTATVYLRAEMLRTVRNVRFFVFSLIMPLVLFLLVAGPNRHEQLGGISFPVYYMSGMVAWGTMAAVMSGGARIAAERTIGWNRQLRLTPLRPSTYVSTKVASGFALALVSIVLLYAAGYLLGVRLDPGQWLELTGLVLVGLVPFAVIGVLLGHLLTSESMGPALGGITAVFALLGGAWGPLATGGVLHVIAECLPSYWLVQSGAVALGGGAWPPRAWVILVAWTVVLVRVSLWAYRRDTQRV